MQPKLYKSMFFALSVLHLSQLHDCHRTGWVGGKERPGKIASWM